MSRNPRHQWPISYPRHRLRGDLDAIVLKAMSKDAVDRYQSAAELASDIARFLDGEPVLARTPSAGYVLRRLAARNKALVAVTLLALVAILAASGVAFWQRQVAMRAQARAEQRFREVRQLANALIFKIHDAVLPLAGSTPVRRTIVNEAIAYLSGSKRNRAAMSPSGWSSQRRTGRSAAFSVTLSAPTLVTVTALSRSTSARGRSAPLAARPGATTTSSARSTRSSCLCSCSTV